MRAIPPIIALGRVAALACVAAVLGSCGSRFVYVGQWEGKRALKGVEGAPAYIINTANTIKLQVLSNGRFRLQDMGVPKEGQITYDDKKATMNVTKIAGIDIERQSQATQEGNGPIDLTPQTDGTLMYHDPKSLDPSNITLKRIATPVKDRP